MRNSFDSAIVSIGSANLRTTIFFQNNLYIHSVLHLTFIFDNRLGVIQATFCFVDRQKCIYDTSFSLLFFFFLTSGVDGRLQHVLNT